MVDLPAYCDRCGCHFTVGNLFGSPGATLHIANVATDCPRCDSPAARILDGVYGVANEIAAILAGPQWTLDRLRELRQQLRELETAETVQELEAQIQELETADPQAVGIIRRVLRSPELQSATAMLGVLVGIVSLIITLITLGAQPSPEEIERIVQSKLYEEQQKAHQPAPEPPAPLPATEPPPQAGPSPTD